MTTTQSMKTDSYLSVLSREVSFWSSGPSETKPQSESSVPVGRLDQNKNSIANIWSSTND